MDLDTALNDQPLAGSRATDLLRADHAAISALFDDYQQALNEDSPSRGALAQAMCMRLDLHGRVKSELFYPMVRVEDPDLIDELLQDYEEIAAQIAALREASIEEEDFDMRVLELIDLVESHLAIEEDELFPLLEERIAPVLCSLGAEIIRFRESLVGSVDDVAARS
jgi:uncharacterized membrane protein YccC